MPATVDEFLLEELELENNATLTDSYHDIDYISVDNLIDDVQENGVYNKEEDIFGLHENESEDDEMFEMDCETALRKAIDDQFNQDCYQ